MTAIGVPRGIGVVLEEVDDAADAFVAQPRLGRANETLENALARLVVSDEVLDRVTLGRGIFGVTADVEIEAGAVLERDVARSSPAHHSAEQVTGDLVGTEASLSSQGARDAVLILESEDASVHPKPP
jgi:hypothetical protein